MPTPLLFGGNEFIYFNENPIKNNHRIKKNIKKNKILGKGCIKKNTKIEIIIQYLIYLIMLLNILVMYLIWDELFNNQIKNLFIE